MEECERAIDGIKVGHIESFWYGILRLVDWVIRVPYYIKWFVQRGIRGYADCNIWNLDCYLAKMIPKALRELADISHGCPPDFFDLYGEKGTEMWKQTLVSMAKGFESWESACDGDAPALDSFARGSKLFIERFQSLWD